MHGQFCSDTSGVVAQVMSRFVALLISAFVLTVSSALAATDCGHEPGAVRILSNDFDSLRIVAAAAMECISAVTSVSKNQTTDHGKLQVPALKANPAKYTVVLVSNDTMPALLNDGLLRPLDDLVAKYGQGLKKKQLVTIDGKVVAVAFMVNAQLLYYRADVLARVGLAPPRSYEQVLEAARVIRDKGIMQYPLAATNRPEWDLAEEFVNMYLGFGGDLFVGSSARAAVDNEAGIHALNMMKSLTAYMRPDFLTYSTDVIAPMWEASEVAMANLWGSRANAFESRLSKSPATANTTRFVSAPTVGGGTTPATTLWWDAFAIAKNTDEKDAVASFVTMLHAISPAVVNAHSDAAVWLASDSNTNVSASGILDAVHRGAKSYPMAPYMGYLHDALGSNLAAFMQGRKSAGKTLQDAVTTYSTAAKEAGYLR